MNIDTSERNRRISERLEHTTVRVTLDTSPHAVPAMQEEAAMLIAELVFKSR